MIARIKELLAGRPVDIPTYGLRCLTRSSENLSSRTSRRSLLLKGILVLEDKRLRDLMDIEILWDTDDDVRIIRRIKRLI